MSFNLPMDEIVPVSTVTVALSSAPHPFEAGNCERILEHWRSFHATNPAVYDGEVALLSSLRLDRDTLVGECHIVRYSTFLYWRSIRPIHTAGHAYTHALLVSSDNALILIRMGPKTVNAGLIYCAAGSFEPCDFRDGKANLEFNMHREVLEETGISLAHVPHEQSYQLLSKTTGTVLFRRYFFDRTADDLAASVAQHIAIQDDSEVDAAIIIRNAEDLPPRLADQMPALIRWHFATPADR